MQFRLWLETLSGPIAWNARMNMWSTSAYGDVTAYVSSKRVSLDVSAYHPQAKKALHALIKQIPETSDFQVEFDGFKAGTVRDFLQDKTYEKRTNEKRLVPYFYHGTSMDAWQDIQEHGLMPRKQTGVDPKHGAFNKPSNPEYVYLATNVGNVVKFAARDASSKDNPPVILKIDSQGIDPRFLVPDEDSRSSDWRKSIHDIGTVAYSGVIDPSHISLFKILKDGQWIDPELSQQQPDDWLASKFKNISSHGLGSWVSPK